jgi:hypothetical protein
MKVHITSTPEYSLEVLKDVVSLLTQIPGELDFVFLKKESLTYDQLELKSPIWKNYSEIESLSFDELFNICDLFRKINKIPVDEFVVVVTSIKNSRGWFSAFNKKDIFVYGVGWEYYTKRDSKYGVAQQIVENIFQSHLELNIDDYKNEPNIHIQSIGCINDMCKQKTEVLLKLRTADICDSCLDRADEMNVNPLVIDHIMGIINKLRDEFVNSNRIKSKVKPENVYIEPDRSVKIGARNISIDALNKVLFIFFLRNLQGVETKLVTNYQEDLYNIYQEIRFNPDRKIIVRMFDGTRAEKPTFETVRSRLNRALVEQLGGSLAEYYILSKVVIKDSFNVFKINLEEEHITIEPYKNKVNKR